MNQKIKNHINTECARLGLQTQVKASNGEFVAADEYTAVKVLAGHLDEMYFFEHWNVELSHELIHRFPLPDSLEDFQAICRLLKIFHTN